MAKHKDEKNPRPRVKGLARKKTKFGHRWVLTVPDFQGIPRSITVHILDTDSDKEFLKKVEKARRDLMRRCACQSFSDYLTAYETTHQLAPNTRLIFRRALDGFGLDDKSNARQMSTLLAKDYKPGTMRISAGWVDTFFRWLIQRGERVRNPAADVHIKGAASVRTRICTDAELDDLRAYARKKEPAFRLYILLLMATGARVSSVDALTPQSLDARDRLHFRNVKAKKPYDYAIRITDAEILALWTEVSRKGYLWDDHDVERYKDRLGAWMHRHFGKDDNGETLSPHSLRHTFASRAVQRGVPMEIVSKLLDHSSVAITARVYARFSQEQMDEAVSRIFEDPNSQEDKEKSAHSEREIAECAPYGAPCTWCM